MDGTPNRPPFVADPRKRLAAGIADRAIRVIIWLTAPWLRPGGTDQNAAETPKRFLIIQLDHLGDTLMSTPVYRAIRSRFPNAMITALVGPWSADLLRNNPNVDDIVAHSAPWFANQRGQASLADRVKAYLSYGREYLDLCRRLRSRRFDVAIDLRGDLRHILLFAYLGDCARRIGYDRTGGSYLLTDCLRFDPAQHLVRRNVGLLTPLGIDPTNVDLKLDAPVSAEDRERVDRLLSSVEALDKALIVVHAGARAAIKQWPADRFAATLNWLGRRYRAIAALVGSREEQRLCQNIARQAGHIQTLVVAGELTLPQAAALLERARLFLGNHSSIQHLATATGAPMVIVFGPDDPAIYGPLTGRAEALVHRPPCWPCARARCPYSTQAHGACIDQITPEEVCQAIERTGWLSPWQRSDAITDYSNTL